MKVKHRIDVLVIWFLLSSIRKGFQKKQSKEVNMKKVINDPNNVVDELLMGMVYAHPDHVRKLDGFEVLVRKNSPVEGKVALVSGGGSGHEPSHGGFVGKGMLDGAVAGAVFTSPSRTKGCSSDRKELHWRHHEL